MQRILLDKKSVIRLYFYLRQTERSVHKALGASWPELKAFYCEGRVSALKQLVEELRVRLPRGNSALAFKDGVLRGSWLGDLTRFVAGKLIGRWRNRWTFPAPAIACMAAKLDAVIELLVLPSKPDPDALIGLRLDLCECRSFIEFRCAGLREIERSPDVEHFWQADWIKPVRLSDLLPNRA